MAKATETPPVVKFVVDYFDENKKLESRWHYDYTKTKNGPILVEEFNLPQKEKKSKGSKK